MLFTNGRVPFHPFQQADAREPARPISGPPEPGPRGGRRTRLRFSYLGVTCEKSRLWDGDAPRDLYIGASIPPIVIKIVIISQNNTHWEYLFLLQETTKRARSLGAQTLT